MVRRFLFVAMSLAAAKVFLNTVGVALFLANEGPAELPRFFILLAVITIVLSAVLGVIVDRTPKLAITRAALVAIMLVAGSGKLLIATEVPGAYFIILSSAYVFEIAIEILFWMTCAAYFDTVELKRATPVLCLGIALGGAFGGLLARALSWTAGTPDLLLIMLLFAGVSIVQFSRLADVGELPDRDPAGIEHGSAHASGFLRMAARYPFLVLVSLNALMLTIVYGISEFLFLSIYSERFPEEQELTRFLGIVFALLQTCEFLLLVVLSRVLLERATPLVRNLVFPLTSFACLLYLSLSDRLHAAVITHLNAEAGSNAIFQPIHNANFLALPLAMQGRARTLSEGVFYPCGLAIAGALLWTMDAAGVAAAAEFVAILSALVFILLNFGVGVLFPPTLIANLRSGVAPLAELPDRIVGLPASTAPRVREFLRSARSDLRLDGIAFARRLGPAHVEDDLLALASHPDLATRRALARLTSEADGRWARYFVDAVYGRDDCSSMVALQVMLARGEALSTERLASLHRSRDPSLRALAGLLDNGGDTSHVRSRLAPMLGHPQVAAEVIDAIVAAERADLAEVVVAALPAAPARQQRHGLEFVHLVQRPLTSSSWWTLGRFVRHRDPGVRAETMAVLGGCPHRASRRALARGLADRSPRVRRSAADALGAQGDDAVDMLRHRLVPIRLGSAEAARALGGMDTARARRALSVSLRQLRHAAHENADLLARLGAAPDPEPWRALVACARDHRARIVELALAALSSSLPQHVLGHVRDALRSKDRRRRADAFEILAALNRSAPAAEALETLRVVLLGLESGEQGTAPGERFDAHGTLALARASSDPWVSQAAGIAEKQAFTPGGGPAPARCRESHVMIPNEQDLERILILKQIPLFRYLPLDTLFAVAHSVEAQRYLPGDVIAENDRRREQCHVLEAGIVSIERGGTTERVAAPGCFNELVLIGEAPPLERVVALEACRVLHLHAVAFQDLGRDHPEILLELCRMLARRVRAAEAADAAPSRGRPRGALSTPAR